MISFPDNSRLLWTSALCIALSLFICCSDIQAAESEPQEQSGKRLTTWQSIGLGGVLSAALAGIAAFEPAGIGVVEVCVPLYLGLHDVLRAKQMWPVALAFGGLGTYNLTIDEDRVSRGRIFGVNFAGMSAAMIISALLHDPKQPGKNQDDRLNAGLSLGQHGGMLAFSYSF